MANYPGMPFTERRLSVFFAVTSSVVTLARDRLGAWIARPCG